MGKRERLAELIDAYNLEAVEQGGRLVRIARLVADDPEVVVRFGEESAWREATFRGDFAAALRRRVDPLCQQITSVEITKTEEKSHGYE